MSERGLKTDVCVRLGLGWGKDTEDKKRKKDTENYVYVGLSVDMSPANIAGSSITIPPPTPLSCW